MPRTEGVAKLEADDVYEHIFEIYSERRAADGQNLGYVDKSTELLEVDLPLSGISVTVRQSISALSSATQSSSTGFICWQSSRNFADWILGDPRCPLRTLLREKVILELGAGVGALLASVLGPMALHYVATDQKHLLKLMKMNFADNCTTARFVSSTCGREDEHAPKQKPDEVWPHIDIMELDWEHALAARGEFEALTGLLPHVILACDTIYNTFLVPYFVLTLKAMMACDTVAIVAMQLRDETVTEEFLDELFRQGLNVGYYTEELLSSSLTKGFMVYMVTQEQQEFL